MDDSYDLVVIGAGPAGEVAAELPAAFGRTVLIVERNTPGGVVTTTGGASTRRSRSARSALPSRRDPATRSSAEISLAVPVAGWAVAGLPVGVVRGGGLDPAGSRRPLDGRTR